MFKILSFPLLLISIASMAQPSARKYLALGDSYTIGEAVHESERWPVLLVNALNAQGNQFDAPEIIATTGWRTDDLKKGIISRNPNGDYDMVSLLIGVNNQYQGRSTEEYAEQFEELLQMAIEFADGDKSKVFVVSIPDYGFTPFGKDKQQSISEQIDEFNDINRLITENMKIQYFNITDISRRGLAKPELVATDGLHPSGEMYKRWVDRMIKDEYFSVKTKSSKE